MSNISKAGAGAIPLVGRVLLAILFILSGLGKLAAPAATQGYIASMNVPLPVVAYAVAVVVEVAGGIMLLVGYRARLAAIALAVFTAAAAFLFHNNFGDQNQFIHFVKNIAIVGGLLQVVGYGAGLLSLDARLAGKSSRLQTA